MAWGSPGVTRQVLGTDGGLPGSSALQTALPGVSLPVQGARCNYQVLHQQMGRSAAGPAPPVQAPDIYTIPLSRGKPWCDIWFPAQLTALGSRDQRDALTADLFSTLDVFRIPDLFLGRGALSFALGFLSYNRPSGPLHVFLLPFSILQALVWIRAGPHRVLPASPTWGALRPCATLLLSDELTSPHRHRDLLHRAMSGIFHPWPQGPVLWFLAGFGQWLRSRGLSGAVVDTLLDARAPSTRALYTSRWKQFSGWCRDQEPPVVPLQAPVEAVLGFLQSSLARGRGLSTLLWLVAAISVYQQGVV